MSEEEKIAKRLEALCWISYSTHVSNMRGPHDWAIYRGSPIPLIVENHLYRRNVNIGEYTAGTYFMLCYENDVMDTIFPDVKVKDQDYSNCLVGKAIDL